MTAPRERLRFAVMCRGTRLRQWQVDCLNELRAVPNVELVALIVDDRDGPQSNWRSRIMRFVRGPNRLWNIFNNVYVARRSSALRTVDLSAELRGIPQVRCRVERRGKYSEYFQSDDLERIRSFDLDFALRFAFGIIRGEILQVPRFGVWSFHHDDEARYRGGPPCFWEIVADDPVTGTMLQRLTDRLDAGVVLQKGWFRTVRHSYVRNSDSAHLGCVAWPAKVAKDLLHGEAAYLDAEPTTSEAPILRNPTDRQMLRFLARLARNFAVHHARSVLFADRWHVGVIDAPISDFLNENFRPNPRWIPPPKNRSVYYADPFGVMRDGTCVLLVEEYDYRTSTGIISSATPREAAARNVLPLPAHASYPFLIERDGDIYCIPELSRTNAVRLFRAVRFPEKWVDEGTLVEDVAALDPTVFRHDGRWWLFCTEARRGSLTSLHAWFADDPLGPWLPHSSNPIKTDVRSARPAGTPFVVDGTLYRPAQDCSRGYGTGIAINRVDVLTPTAFAETVVRTVVPTWSRYTAGTHTIAAVENMTLVDAKQRKVIAASVRHELLARIARGRRRS